MGSLPHRLAWLTHAHPCSLLFAFHAFHALNVLPTELLRRTLRTLSWKGAVVILHPSP
jgi:hypothetical protein